MFLVSQQTCYQSRARRTKALKFHLTVIRALLRIKIIDLSIQVERAEKAMWCRNDPSANWHERLGHPSKEMLEVWLNENNIKFGRDSVTFCEPCSLAKQAKRPFKNEGTRAIAPLDVVHSDMIGPINQVSTGGARYILTFIDDYSRYTIVYFMKEKR